MNSPPSTRVPVLVPGKDIRQLPIGPEEAFLISRIDGTASAKVLAAATALPTAKVTEHLRRLCQLGIVRFDVEGGPPPSGAASTEGARDTPPAKKAVGNEPAATHSRGSEARNAPVLSAAQIQQLYAELPLKDYYELLGVSADATRQEIKSAYFQQVSQYHPDTYYGQALGSAKPKLEALFKQLTLAYDTLTRAKRRRAYDAQRSGSSHRSSPESRRSNALRRSTAPPQNSPGPAEPARPMTVPPTSAPCEPAAGQPTSSPVPQPPASVPAPAPISVGTRGAPQAEGSDRPPASSSRHRRQALARKLMPGGRRSTSPPKPSKSEPPVPVPHLPPPPQSIALRGQSGPAPAALRRSGQFAQTAEAEMNRGNRQGAANSLRLALALTPENEQLKQRLDDVESALNRENADAYLAQGEAHLRSANYSQGAKLLGRAADGKNSATLFRRAAEAALKAADAKTAAGLAKRAASLKLDDPQSRQLLAEAYLMAGMTASAEAEWEAARRLDSSLPSPKTWLEAHKRGDV